MLDADMHINMHARLRYACWTWTVTVGH